MPRYGAFTTFSSHLSPEAGHHHHRPVKIGGRYPRLISIACELKHWSDKADLRFDSVLELLLWVYFTTELRSTLDHIHWLTRELKNGTSLTLLVDR